MPHWRERLRKIMRKIQSLYSLHRLQKNVLFVGLLAKDETKALQDCDRKIKNTVQGIPLYSKTFRIYRPTEKGVVC